jgi:hypothetical protein
VFGLDIPPSLPNGWERLTDDISSANYSEAIEETYRFWGKSWSELEMADFDECTLVFSFLPREHVPYFFGALMELSLREAPYSYNLLELFTLFDPSIAKGKQAKQFLAFNNRQIASLEEKHFRTIVAFLQFLAVSGHEDERSYYMQEFLREKLS